MMTIKMEGLRRVNSALEKFPPRIATKVLSQGARAGGAVLRNAQRVAAPMRSSGDQKRISWSVGAPKYNSFRGRGFLKKNIKSMLRRKKSDRRSKVYGVGPYGDAYYGYIVERGHRILEPKGSGINSGKPAPFSGKTVAPHPFLIPAFYANVARINKAIKDRLSLGIATERRKLGFFTNK